MAQTAADILVEVLPGGLHLLNGVYDAKLDGQSVLAITGMPYHDLIGTRIPGCRGTPSVPT